MEQRNYTEKRMNSLINDEGKVIDQPEEIMQETHRFYSHLYKENRELISNWTKNLDMTEINKLREEQRALIEGHVRYEEIAQTVKSMPNNKSPGVF